MRSDSALFLAQAGLHERPALMPRAAARNAHKPARCGLIEPHAFEVLTARRGLSRRDATPRTWA